MMSGSSLATAEGLWTFFTRFALALYAFAQAVAFYLCFTHVLGALSHRRDMKDLEKSAHADVVLLKGNGWLATGFALGVIETVLGFAPGLMGIVLARRIARLLSRTCLCIGLLRG